MDGLILEESEHISYGPRTAVNASRADITIAIAVDFTTFGEVLTKKVSKKYLPITYGTPISDAVESILQRLMSEGHRSINLAGNGGYTLIKYGLTQALVNRYVYDLIKGVHDVHPLVGLRSGGQTGIDFSAAVVGPLLGIPTKMLFPKGYKQRYTDGVDVLHTQEEILTKVEKWQQLLKTELASGMVYGPCNSDI